MRFSDTPYAPLRKQKDNHTCDIRMPSASHIGNIVIRHFY